ncbi:MAG: hypothetical protein CMQ34_06470 [Gammaproteobacteria bacterium]|nr:hypothetical protein [Gammaproteobacteria bacterium]|tara:strand:+ start:419 stop:1066 length:648 start_codon:yes stop_codon:yes gene_type:complete
MTSTQLLASVGAAVFSVSAAAQGPSPYLQPDDTWISLSGTVESVQQDAFLLDYGRGSVTVEMDDGDRDADAYALQAGDNVVVSGLIDDDFFEMTTIEASSVFVESINTFFYASALDDESMTFFDPIVTVQGPLMQGDTTLQGTISAVDRDEQAFILNTGVNMVTVEVDGLGYDPLDDVGYLQLENQDVVTVRGTMTEDLIEGRVFEAASIVSVKP